MELTATVVAERAAEYRETEALAAVEADHVEMFPSVFAAGEFGWRDAVWVVRWYYRRFLGAVPNADRREGEEAFDANDFETVQDVIQEVSDGSDVEEQIDRLTDLHGVDVPIASAFLQFIDPSDYMVLGEREWTVLERAGELARPYPTPPAPADYADYLETVRRVADRCDCDAWTLYQAVWRLAKAELDEGSPSP